jgi:3-mercaptopyruvate sulfurtransferase SseA
MVLQWAGVGEAQNYDGSWWEWAALGGSALGGAAVGGEPEPE